jgi:hypothetical protein
MSQYNPTKYKGKVNIEYEHVSFQMIHDVHVISETGETLYCSKVNARDLNKLLKKLKREFNVDEVNDGMIHMPEGVFHTF